MTDFIVNKTNKKEELKIPLEESRLLFLTGAGISTGSGLPTYHGKDGAYTKMNARPEDIINQFNMDNHTYKIWDAIGELIKAGATVNPTISHLKISEIEKYAKESLVFTQNIDDLHFKAGSKNIIQIHGKGKHAECLKCQSKELDAVKLVETRENGKCPICPVCGHDKVRPCIVPFYGMPSRDEIEDSFRFCQKGVDYCFVIGTQLAFPYIQNILYYVRRYNPNAIIININPEVTISDEGFDVFYKTNSDDFFSNTEIK